MFTYWFYNLLKSKYTENCKWFLSLFLFSIWSLSRSLPCFRGRSEPWDHHWGCQGRICTLRENLVSFHFNGVFLLCAVQQIEWYSVSKLTYLNVMMVLFNNPIKTSDSGKKSTSLVWSCEWIIYSMDKNNSVILDISSRFRRADARSLSTGVGADLPCSIFLTPDFLGGTPWYNGRGNTEVYQQTKLSFVRCKVLVVIYQNKYNTRTFSHES